MYADIVTDIDGHYGDTSFWDANWKNRGGELTGQNNPSIRAGRIQVLNGIDRKRFTEFFTDLMTRPTHRST